MFATLPREPVVQRQNAATIERFHSRGQHLCKCIGTKESVYIRKEFNSYRTGLGQEYGHRDVMRKRPKECFHMTSCPYPPYSVVSHDNEMVGGILVLQILSFLLFLENLHSCWARV